MLLRGDQLAAHRPREVPHVGLGTASPDWVVLAVPAPPAEELYLELLDAGVDVHRAGDVVAPRRAHAAVVDGERVGAAL